MPQDRGRETYMYEILHKGRMYEVLHKIPFSIGGRCQELQQVCRGVPTTGTKAGFLGRDEICKTPLPSFRTVQPIESHISTKSFVTRREPGHPLKGSDLSVTKLFQGESQTAATCSSAVRQRKITGSHYIESSIETVNTDSATGVILQHARLTLFKGT
jgi:hypothetical protein